MEKIKVVIIEDEFPISEDIRSRLELAGYEALAAFDKGETALSFLLQKLPDLLLVDIRLAGTMDGIHLVKELQKHSAIPVIYITANSDAATYERARDTRPHAFLVKPFTPANLLAAVDLALYHFSTGKTSEYIARSNDKDYPAKPFTVNHCLFIKANGRYKKISGEDLLFIEAAGSYVHIQTKGERFTLSQNLTHFQKKTPLPNLVRIHRSFIVNMNKVDSFDDSSVFIGTHKMPLGDSYKPDFLACVHSL